MNTKDQETRWFLFYKDQILLHKQETGYTIPSGIEPPVPAGHLLEVTQTGQIPCRTAALSEPIIPNDDFAYVGLRASWDVLDRTAYLWAGRAYQLLYWDQHSRYCPACGEKMEQTTPICKQSFPAMTVDHTAVNLLHPPAESLCKTALCHTFH